MTGAVTELHMAQLHTAAACTRHHDHLLSPQQSAGANLDLEAVCMCCCNLQKDEFLRLAINGIHNDLISRNEAFQSLALTFVSNSKPPAAVGPAP